MSAIDEILELLEDGKWHDIKEAIKKSNLQEFKIEMIFAFLADYAFVDFDREQKKAKLSPATLKFFREIQHIENEKCVM